MKTNECQQSSCYPSFKTPPVLHWPLPQPLLRSPPRQKLLARPVVNNNENNSLSLWVSGPSSYYQPCLDPACNKRSHHPLEALLTWKNSVVALFFNLWHWPRSSPRTVLWLLIAFFLQVTCKGKSNRYKLKCQKPLIIIWTLNYWYTLHCSLGAPCRVGRDQNSCCGSSRGRRSSCSH